MMDGYHKESILVVLPTVPRRVRTAQLVVRQLLRQPVSKFIIYANGHDRNQIISTDPRVHHIYTPPGTGPGVRFAGGARGHSYVLTVDDDLRYPPDYVTTMTRQLDRLGSGFVISQHATSWEGPDRTTQGRSILKFFERSDSYVECDYVGVGVAALRAKEFDFLSNGPPARLSHDDDIWMSAVLKASGVRLVRPPSAENWITSYPESDDAEGIHETARRDNFRSRDQAIAWAECAYGWSRGPARPLLSQRRHDD